MSYPLHAPRCICCQDRRATWPAGNARTFCSMSCAADYGNMIAGGNDLQWCPWCRDWVYWGGTTGYTGCSHGVVGDPGHVRYPLPVSEAHLD